MNKPLTVKELCDLCKQEIANGNGDKVIMISNDDEGNGYHYLWYSFQTASKMLGDIEEDGLPDEFLDIDGVDESVAKIEDTIILG